MLRRRIALAWKQLTKERGRMMVAIAGIAFKVRQAPRFSVGVTPRD